MLNGVYDVNWLYKEVHGVGHGHDAIGLSHELLMEYLGPVEVRLVDGDEAKGRGIFATRAIKQGEFLMVQRSFASSENTGLSAEECNQLADMFKV